MLFNIEPNISVITHIELFSSNKISEKENLALLSFIQIATIFNYLEMDIINQSIAIRKKYKTKLPDAIIAATAIVNNLVLLTRNTSDFRMTDNLRILNPHI